MYSVEKKDLNCNKKYFLYLKLGQSNIVSTSAYSKLLKYLIIFGYTYGKLLKISDSAPPVPVLLLGYGRCYQDYQDEFNPCNLGITVSVFEFVFAMVELLSSERFLRVLRMA